MGLATKEFTKPLVNLCTEDERGMVFRGFLAFLDPPKASAIPSIKDFKEKGIEVKVCLEPLRSPLYGLDVDPRPYVP